ncbi:MAG TPA: hypothetical protein VFR86_10050 [Burkholderiaceae bacterium]|nr:hypothetical protein [Burkholderiaceae bacterium]
MQRLGWLGAAAAVFLLSGCAVIAVVDTAASIAVGAVGVAADVAVGTAKVVGKAAGAAVDAVTGDDDSKDKGAAAKKSEPPAPAPSEPHGPEQTGN